MTEVTAPAPPHSEAAARIQRQYLRAADYAYARRRHAEVKRRDQPEGYTERHSREDYAAGRMRGRPGYSTLDAVSAHIKIREALISRRSS